MGKDQRFPAKVWNFVTTSIDSLAILCKVRCMYTSSAGFKIAVSVRCGFQELTAKVKKLRTVSVNKLSNF